MERAGGIEEEAAVSSPREDDHSRPASGAILTKTAGTELGHQRISPAVAFTSDAVIKNKTSTAAPLSSAQFRAQNESMISTIIPPPQPNKLPQQSSRSAQDEPSRSLQPAAISISTSFNDPLETQDVQARLLPIKSNSDAISIQANMNKSPRSRLNELLAIPMTPFTPAPGVFRCSICWESSSNASDFIAPCICKNDNLKYAHQRCIDQWVNNNGQDRCAVCQTVYKIRMKPIPLLEVVRRNQAIFLSLSLQVAFPVGMYMVLYLTDTLARMNRSFIMVNLGMLLILYGLYIGHSLSSIEWHRRHVMPLNADF